MRSPSRSCSRSGRGGGAIGGAATGFAAGGGGGSNTASEVPTVTLSIAAFTRSAKKGKGYSQDHVRAVLALQELSRSGSGYGEDDRQKQVALEIGGVKGGRHSMSGEKIRRREAHNTNAPDRRHGGSRWTSRSGKEIAHKSYQVMTGTSRSVIVARDAPTSIAAGPTGVDGKPAKTPTPRTTQATVSAFFRG